MLLGIFEVFGNQIFPICYIYYCCSVDNVKAFMNFSVIVVIFGRFVVCLSVGIICLVTFDFEKMLTCMCTQGGYIHKTDQWSDIEYLNSMLVLYVSCVLIQLVSLCGLRNAFEDLLDHGLSYLCLKCFQAVCC